MTRTTTFFIQARLGDDFEDLYIAAASLEAALAKAPAASALYRNAGGLRRWVRFVAG